MPRRSLAATLAIAFGLTSLAVLVLVGSYLYVALERQVKTQDDTEVVLASRHARRLAEEIDTKADLKSHAPRLVSVVLGNRALSMVVFDAHGDRLLFHGSVQVLDDVDAESDAITRLDPTTLPAQDTRVNATSEITAADVREWTTAQGIRVRSVAFDMRLRDGTVINGIVARDERASLKLLDRYRDQLTFAGVAGTLLAMLAGYALIRLLLRPLRRMTTDATGVTVSRLHSRLPEVTTPSELGDLARALNTMLARLEQGFGRLSQFTADLAHDMRTPIANIRGATEVALQRTRSPEEYQALLASNLEECDRLSRMIGNVLFLARAEHPQFVTNMREIALHAELDTIVGYFEGVAEETGSAIVVTCPEALTLRADLELFRRAVGNLLANAIRYSTPAQPIGIAVTPAATHVDVAVTNAGPAIAEGDLEHIFERFYRGDKARGQSTDMASSGGSAGLGLAIVRTIMELHGGRVSVTCAQGQTTFVLRWPRQ